MPNYFPPISAYPKGLDSDYTLYLVHNTSETITTQDNMPWSDEISIRPVGPTANEIWGTNGYANLEGELFYYDDVGYDINGKINRLKRCARNLGGTTTKFNAAGSEVRGFVIAEHHNQLVNAILNTQNFIGENFSNDTTTLDFKIRNLQSLPVIFDDFSCPDINFTFYIESSDPATGILARYDIVIDGTFTSYRLDFGDGSSTTTSTNGTHRYSLNAEIDPVLTISNSKCTLVQTPITRESPIEPQYDTESTTFEIQLPEIPVIPPIFIPEPPTPTNAINIPPIVFPCLDIGPIGPIEIPSVIVIDPPLIIPSEIVIGPFDIPSEIVIVGEFPSEIVINPPPEGFPPIDVQPPPGGFPPIDFGPVPPFPPVLFGPPPTFPAIPFAPPPTIPFAPFPEIPPIDFGPVPEIPPIEFGPVPEIPPIEFGPPPEIPPIEFGPAPDFPPIGFGPPPAIPPVTFGPAPSVPVNWGTPPACNCTVTVSCGGGTSGSGGSSSSFADAVDGFSDIDPIEVQVGDIGIPSEIFLRVPEIPDIRILHDIPAIIRVEVPDIPDIKIISPDIPLPSEIRIIGNEIPSVIELISTDLPSSIALDFSGLPTSIKLEMPDEFPMIKIDASGIPDQIQVVGIPSAIELIGAPSEIKLVLPDKPEVELVYKGSPIDVKINLDISRLTGENGNSQCVAIVPCGNS